MAAIANQSANYVIFHIGNILYVNLTQVAPYLLSLLLSAASVLFFHSFQGNWTINTGTIFVLISVSPLCVYYGEDIFCIDELLMEEGR